MVNYFTPHDLAQRFHVTERQICKLARIGYLPGIKFGKLWRFREDMIEEWERRQSPMEDIGKLADEIIKGG
jgi:excisionase family DNA binding protein